VALSFKYLLFKLNKWLYVQDNADRTSSFVVLINLLRPLDPSRWPSLASNESFAARNQKFSDLVVKCLIKLTKVTFHLSTLVAFFFFFRIYFYKVFAYKLAFF
jgi:hypothetical protein